MGGRGGSGRSIAAPALPATVPSAAPAAASSSLEDQILSNYQQLRGRFDNEWVILTELRNAIGGTRAQQDEALLKLVKERKIRLIPEENQKTLSPADRAAALRLSGEDKHLIGIPS